MKNTFSIIIFFVCYLFPSSSFAQHTYQDYLDKRAALVQKDSITYFDHQEILSPAEEKLAKKLKQLQEEMVADYKNNHFFPPARNFYLSQEHMKQTPLFNILKKMPKGGILHLHTPAMGDAEWIVKKAIDLPEMYVYWDQPNGTYVKGQLQAFHKKDRPNGFYPAQELAQSNPAFSDSLVALLTFDNNLDKDSVDIWLEFEYVFQRIYKFVSYKPVAPEYWYHGLKILVDDNIQHAELRMPFRNMMYDLDHPSESFPIEDFVQALENTLIRIRKLDPHFTFNLIHINLRFRDKQTIWEDMQTTYQHRKKFPKWLRGYDLVAQEDNGHSTLFHAKTFLQLDSLERVHGVSLPIYLHDGESCWASVDNLYDAVLLGTKRIGHGFNLFRFPALLEMVKEQNICMEINPLSNQILGYIRDLRLHPASTYLRRGINCTISSDDPLIFNYHGLTPDYWSVALAWDLDLAALKKLSRNGILYSNLPKDEQEKALKVWEERWNKFVQEALN